MPELRIDPISGRRVYVAEERADRPFDYVDQSPARGAGAAECPFCAGREALTPETSAAVCDAAGRWQVRVVPNKFPAVRMDGDAAVGVHEVIVESPEHLVDLAQLDHEQLTRVVCVYQQRLRHWAAIGPIEHALIFKNSGLAAGASMEHVHSQLVAAPYVHTSVQTEAHAAQRHFAAERRCIFCELVRREIAAGDRVVLRLDGLAAITAYAGRQPYETWILPVDHAARFEQMDQRQAADLANLLGQLLRRLAAAAGAPAYNLVLHTAPFGGAHDDSYHWHWELIPRITQLAGLELGGGAYINPVSPERAARRLREVSLPGL